MFDFLKKKPTAHKHSELERQMEFLLMIMIGILRRYDISEEEIARVIQDEKFISELYLNRLVSLLNEKEANDQNNK